MTPEERVALVTLENRVEAIENYIENIEGAAKTFNERLAETLDRMTAEREANPLRLVPEGEAWFDRD